MKNRQIQPRWRSFLVDQDGTVGIVILVLLPILFGFAGLAVDKGHQYVATSQLKNAADAGALAGARGLFPYYNGQPDWVTGAARAKDTVEKNSADTHSLTVSVASPGSAVPPLDGGALLSQATPCYWNLNDKTTKPSNATPLANDVPAMQVSVSKTAGQNDGPVQRYLAPVLNIIPGVFIEPTVDVTGTSVAAIVPKGVGPGKLKPMVATKTIVDKYWNMSDSSGQPFQFKIGDGKTAEDTMWSSFKVDNNSDAYTKQLIEKGNPSPLSIGDSIHLQPGAKAVDYGPNEMGLFINQTVVLPIVAPATLVANTDAPIIGFVAFHITGYNQGGQYVEGYFDKNYVITNPQGITIPQGLNSPPFFQLVN